MMSARAVRIVYRVHKWLGLAGAAFVLLSCLTGSLLMFRDEIEVALEPARRVASSGAKLTLAQCVAAAEKAYPGRRVTGLTIYPQYALTLYLSAPDFLQIYVDPYSGRVIGQKRASGSFDLVRRLHVRLNLAGRAGRVSVALIGLLLLGSALSGLWIYGPFRRGNVVGVPRAERQLRVSDAHKWVGVGSVAFLVVLGLSGVLLAAYPFLPPMTPPPRPGAASIATPISPDAAVLHATAILEPTGLIFPTPKSFRYVVYGNSPGVLAQGSSAFQVVDALDGSLRDAYLPGAHPLHIAQGLHFGNYGGPAVRIVYVVSGFSGCALAASGPCLSWLKRRHGSSAGALPRHPPAA